MIWLAGFFLITSLLGGIARLGFFFINAGKLPGLVPKLPRKSVLSIALVNIVFASAGLYCLFAKVFDPSTILVVVLLVTSLVEISLTVVAKKRPSAR